MIATTVIYVVLSWLLWKGLKDKTKNIGIKLLIGLIYGLCSVLATHMGVEYSQMIINIRDVGPLTAGLFFDPVSGIIAGLIGGVERYIAGIFWGIGSYTTIACSISTIMAGILAAVLRTLVFKNKRPFTVNTLFIGAVMEVFHMYAVFITHHDDISNAFYVVKNCSVPMILFTAISLFLFSLSIDLTERKWKVFKRKKREETPVSFIFQARLLIITFIILALNFLFIFNLQTRSAYQNSEDLLAREATEIKGLYQRVYRMNDSINELATQTALENVVMIAESISENGGMEAINEEFIDDLREDFGLISLNVIDTEKNPVFASGSSYIYTSRFGEVFNGDVYAVSVLINDSSTAALCACDGGYVQVVFSIDKYKKALNFSGLNHIISNISVSGNGSFDVVRNTGYVAEGNHRLSFLEADLLQHIKDQPDKTMFEASYFGVNSFCWKEPVNEDSYLLITIPASEAYASRDAQAYETALAAILLFAVIYYVITILVRLMVVNSLEKVNASLGKITEGNLDEVVDVRTSSEFNTLSDDINQTVTVLKSYITAAEKRIEQELELARIIQESALPKNFRFPRSDFNMCASMDPAREVGGDFYDFFMLDSNKLALVIADVSGKGIPAALFMMRGKTLIQNLAESGCSPSEILYKANNSLCSGNEAEMFITAWIGIINLDTGLMQCSNAGHEYPIVKKVGENYQVYKDKHGLVLAAMEDARYTEYELQFGHGDKLFVYTDGIPEAVNENVEQYGLERLNIILNEAKNQSPKDTLKTVSENIFEFVGNADQFDDITMISFEYLG